MGTFETYSESEDGDAYTETFGDAATLGDAATGAGAIAYADDDLSFGGSFQPVKALILA